MQQTDGKRVLLGSFVQLGTIPTPTGLVRLLAGSNQIDPVFQSNTAGLQGTIDQILLLPGDKLLLVSRARAAFTLGAVTRQTLLRLNADGTPDPTFDIGTGPNLIVNDLAVQPDGKLLLIGAFTAVSGVPVGRLARLNVDGTLDTAFQAAGTGLNTYGTNVVIQANGNIIVGGNFTAVHGQPADRLARLTSTGAFDASFAAVLPVSTSLYIASLAVQPDGKVLVASGSTTGAVTGWAPLMRLLPSGAIDTGFLSGTNFNRWFLAGPALLVQPDGRIIVGSSATMYNGNAIGRVVRLLANGTLDSSFASGAIGPAPSSLQLLSTGSVLLNYALVQPDGTQDSSFAPAVQRPGYVFNVVRQPDDKLLVAGGFTSINGIAANGLARLNANGSPDPSFSVTITSTSGQQYVRGLALQPDGKLLIGGTFDNINGVGRQALARLLPTGALDATFAPTLQGTAAFSTPSVNNVVLQPDGNVLLNGTFAFSAGSSLRSSGRVSGTTGLEDTGFQPPATFDCADWLPLPGGIIIAVGVGIIGQYTTACRLLASGAVDPTFTIAASGGVGQANTVARDGAGRLYLGGYFSQVGTVSTMGVARLLPDGTPDATFVANATNIGSNIHRLAVQPNGRVLVGGLLYLGPGYGGTVRLLPNGATDFSYTSINGPTDEVYQLLVQPDGAIVAGGSFTTVSALPIMGLTRLLDANVLRVSSPQVAARTQAWPVPAHGQLHLDLDAASRPQRVELLDALGRVVLAQPAPQPVLTLDTATLPAGTYVLRVQYASGLVARRVVLE